MIDLGSPQPLTDAIAHLSAKTPIGSVLKSADWESLPLQLRERGQWAARVESMRVLQRIQDRLLNAAKLLRRPEGAFQTREKFITEIRAIGIEEGLHLTVEDGYEGTVRDITSEARLGMIFDIQTQKAQGFARWKADQDRDLLDAFPAQEFLRVEDRDKPREDWHLRWADAGGRTFNGRAIALKNDPVWRKLSRFGTPWPPFDYQSGMGVADVSRDLAEQLGVLPRGRQVLPEREDFNADLEASVRNVDPRLVRALGTIFEEQIEIAGDRIKWKGDTHAEPRQRERDNARQISDRVAGVLGRVRPGDVRDEDGAAIQADAERSWAAEIAAVANGRKQLFHEQLNEYAADKAAVLQEALADGVQVRAIDGHLYVWRPDVLPVSIERAHQLSVENRNGELLGYGVPSIGEEASVIVRIRDATRKIVGGFHAPAEQADIYARERGRDYSDAWGEPITAEVYR